MSSNHLATAEMWGVSPPPIQNYRTGTISNIQGTVFDHSINGKYMKEQVASSKTLILMHDMEYKTQQKVLHERAANGVPFI